MSETYIIETKDLTNKSCIETVIKEITFTNKQLDEIREIAEELDTCKEEIIEYISYSNLFKDIESEDFMQKVKDSYFEECVLGL